MLQSPSKEGGEKYQHMAASTHEKVEIIQEKFNKYDCQLCFWDRLLPSSGLLTDRIKAQIFINS